MVDGRDRSAEICSIHSLACLTGPEMRTVAERLRQAPHLESLGVDLPQLAEAPDRLVSPGEIRSAGRVLLGQRGDRAIPMSLIFSVSVPFDVMVDVEIHAHCGAARCMQECLRYAGLVRDALRSLIPRPAVECVTVVVADRAMLDGLQPSHALKELARDDEPPFVLYRASYPPDCFLIVGLQLEVVAEIQAMVQNLFRVRGGAQHLHRRLTAHLRENVLPLRGRVDRYAAEAPALSTGAELRSVRPLRADLFHLQRAHSELETEYRNLLEFEDLYLRTVSGYASGLASLAEDARSQDLVPVERLHRRAAAHVEALTSYVDGAVAVVYADVNLALSRRMNLLTWAQAVMGVILFVITLLQLMHVNV